MYNWNAVADSKFAPVDYKVPTNAEWDVLIAYLGGTSVAGGKLKQSGTTHWNSPNTGADNSSGFTALPSGVRSATDSSFIGSNASAYWWTKTGSGTSAYAKLVTYSSAEIAHTYPNVRAGFSCRLLWNGVSPPPLTAVDYDGNIYDVVKIGTQYWIGQNWKCTKLNDGTSLTKVADTGIWQTSGGLYYCAYNNDETNV